MSVKNFRARIFLLWIYIAVNNKFKGSNTFFLVFDCVCVCEMSNNIFLHVAKMHDLFITKTSLMCRIYHVLSFTHTHTHTNIVKGTSNENEPLKVLTNIKPHTETPYSTPKHKHNSPTQYHRPPSPSSPAPSNFSSLFHTNQNKTP